MKSLNFTVGLRILFIIGACTDGKAATLHVDLNSANPTPPYSTWAAAATNIQDAVNAATARDTVLVADGIYDSGETSAPGSSRMNRVCITNDITMHSVNGPNFTFIVGSGTNATVAVRGVSMSAGTISGFTITNCYIESNGGGVFMDDGVVTNCVLSGNMAGYGGGGCRGGILYDCVLTENSAQYGGGCVLSTLIDCTLIGNTATSDGGGVHFGTLNNCKLYGNLANNGGGSSNSDITNCEYSNNTASGDGGGVFSGEASGCDFTSNIANNGGGTYDSHVNNCRYTNNTATAAGGGMCEGVATNCSFSGNSANDGGASSGGTLSNCTFSGNTAIRYGGGSSGGTLYDCRLEGNHADTWGGGSSEGTLYECLLVNNSAVSGGGSCFSVLNSCTLSGNVAEIYGGGAYEGTLNNCLIENNSVANNHYEYTYGGGVFYATLHGCLLKGNSADFGGGSSECVINNSTVMENSAVIWGGGSYNDALRNCIVYFNSAAFDYDNWYGGNISYSCTSPDPGGTGNISSDPMLVSASHIHVDSPCVAAGNTDFSTGVDIDGDAWKNPPSMGCDEPQDAPVGDLNVVISADYTNTVIGHLLSFAGEISGTADLTLWSFGDGMAVSNSLYASHAWETPGDYPVILTAWNDSHLSGISATSIVHVVSNSYFYVDSHSVSPAYPYLSWETAASDIQDAVDAAEQTSVVGAVVWVTNGFYNTGGARIPEYTSMNRVCITRDITVQSANGPDSTFIVGSGPLGPDAVRGVYMSAGTLSGFTITNGHSALYEGSWNHCDIAGGGVNMLGGDGIVRNCVLDGNTAEAYGGGSYYGTLLNCVIRDNYAAQGGGSYNGTLNNCNVVSNSAGFGGGSYFGSLRNSVIWNNSARTSNELHSTTVSFSSSPGLVHGIDGNITNAPMFIGMAEGDYRLQSESSCIDAGVNQEWMFSTEDLSGHPRVLNGTVDLGAYETPYTLNALAILQAAYDTNTHHMAVVEDLTLTSPYANDPQILQGIPSNSVDWVLVELMDTNKTTVVSKSAFLNTDGQLISTKGDMGITAEVSVGDYYVVLKHRNHLAAMSAEPVAFTNILTSYNFTTGADKYADDTH